MGWKLLMQLLFQLVYTLLKPLALVPQVLCLHLQFLPGRLRVSLGRPEQQRHHTFLS